MQEINITFVKSDDRAITPKIGTEGALCFDLFPATVESVDIWRNDRGDREAQRILEDRNMVIWKPFKVVFNTKLKMAIPQDFGVIYRERSSTMKSKYPMMMKAGVIDSDYRGEWFLPFLMWAPGKQYAVSYANELVDPRRVKALLQAIILPKYKINFISSNKLDNTQRGDKMYGSSDGGQNDAE